MPTAVLDPRRLIGQNVTAVSPSLAIISAGKDNSYVHPHVEVTDRLTAHNIPYKNTADEGSVVLVSDGNEIYLK